MENSKTKNYIPPQSPVAIQPGDKGFEIVGKSYNRWIWSFPKWGKQKAKIIDPNTNWDLNKKPMGQKEIKKKMKNLYLKELEDFSTDLPNIEVHPEYMKASNEIPNHIKESEGKFPLITPYLNVDSKKAKKGKKNLENLKDYRDWLLERKSISLGIEDYDPSMEYTRSDRRKINLDWVRKTKEYRNLLDLGFAEDTSDQQEINNTMKFVRKREREREEGKDKVFYTIHPTGTVRRYNPPISDEAPEGSGNDIKVFPEPFVRPRDYKRALRYLFQYLRRKQIRGDYR